MNAKKVKEVRKELRCSGHSFRDAKYERIGKGSLVRSVVLSGDCGRKAYKRIKAGLVQAQRMKPSFYPSFYAGRAA